jgi:trigger factor
MRYRAGQGLERMGMKVTIEDVSSVKKVLHIEVPLEDVTRELDSAYKNLKKTAKVKGFRPGKTPRSILERMYGKDVQADVSGKLIQESFVEAIREKELDIVGSPQVDPPEVKADAPYAFDATIEVRPEIADIDFKGLALKKTRYSVTDQEIQAQIEMLQKRLAEKTPVAEARPLADGDFALIDYEGFKDGEPFDATELTENYTLQMGKGQISQEFDHKIQGMNAGETRKIEVAFADDYFNEKLKGLTIEFEVTLSQILEETLPEIDDELAKKLGPFSSMEDVKQAINKNLTEGYEKRTEQELNEQIFQALIEKSEFEVPGALIQMELDGILDEAERSFQSSNVTMEQLGLTREGLSEKYRETAEKQARRHLILGKIVEQETMTLSDEALDAGFQEIADAYQQPVEGIKGFYSQSAEKLEVFKHALLEKEAIKLIIEEGQVEEVEPELEAEEAK